MSLMIWVKTMIRSKCSACRTVAFLGKTLRKKSIFGIPVLRYTEDFGRFVSRRVVDRVVCADGGSHGVHREIRVVVALADVGYGNPFGSARTTRA